MLFTLFTLFWCYLRYWYYFCKVDYFSVSDMLFSGCSNNLVGIDRIPVIWVIFSTHTLFLYVLADIYFYQVIYMLAFVPVLRNHYKEVHFLLLLCFIQFSYNIISLSLILVISVSISSSVSSCIHSYRLAYHSIELHNFKCYIYNFALETLN